MKILLVSDSGYGLWYSLRLEEEGHTVDYYLMKKEYKNILAGIAPEPFYEKPDWKKYDLVVFDFTGNPNIAEEAMEETNVIGDGDFVTQLEDDRLFGLEVMEEVGIEVPPYEHFDNLGAAKSFIKKYPKSYVFKPFDSSNDKSLTYVSSGADDLLDFIDKLGSMEKGTSFLLQEVVQGTEVSTEAYFNGKEFFLINATLEEKKFMNDGKGPNTGCAGNLVWVYQNEPKIFREGLGLMKDYLQQYNFRGMIDLNTIVSDTKVYGLEWTPRFGYDASATLFSLLSNNLGDFFHAIASGDSPDVQLKAPFAAAVRISIPPYPSEIKGHHEEGIPIHGIVEDDVPYGCYLYDAMLEKDELVTAGVSGFIAVPISYGATIAEAFYKVCRKVDAIKIPNMQYRTDLEKKTKERYNTLLKQGWLR